MFFNFLTEKKNLKTEEVAAALLQDYQAGGRADTPIFLRPHLPRANVSRRDRSRGMAPKRQQRHLAQKTAQPV
jgi:hypothetical protein